MKATEIYRWQAKELALEVSKGEVAAFRSKNIEKSTARISNAHALQQSASIGAVSDSELLDRAAKGPEVGPALGYALPGPRQESFECATLGGDLFDAFPATVAQDLSFLRKEAPEFLFSGKVMAFDRTESIRNSFGTLLTGRTQGHSLDLMYKHRSSAGILDGAIGAVSLTSSTFRQAIARHLPYLNAFSRQVPWSKTRHVPVAMLLDEQGILERLLVSARMDRYRDGTALYSGKLGQPLFNPAFSLSDICNDPGRAVFRPFDSEGFVRPSSEFALIKHGVFQGLVADHRNAAKYGVKPTGNGLRSFEGGLGLGFNGAAVAPGPRSYQEIFRDLPECIFVHLAFGGSTTADGIFSTPVQLAFWMEKGEIKGRLPQIAIRAPLDRALGADFIEVARDALAPEALSPLVFMGMEAIPL